MTPSAILRTMAADDWNALYRCRHDREHRESTLKSLMELIQNPKPAIHHDAMNAVGRIAGAFDVPNALAACVPVVCEYVRSDNLLTRQIAVGVLNCIGKHDVNCSVAALVTATSEDDLLDDALLALVAVADSTPDVVRCFQGFLSHPKGKIRKIAIRGLGAIKADDSESVQLLRHALEDRSKVVREMAQKTLARLQPQS